MFFLEFFSGFFFFFFLPALWLELGVLGWYDRCHFEVENKAQSSRSLRDCWRTAMILSPSLQTSDTWSDWQPNECYSLRVYDCIWIIGMIESLNVEKIEGTIVLPHLVDIESASTNSWIYTPLAICETNQVKSWRSLCLWAPQHGQSHHEREQLVWYHTGLWILQSPAGVVPSL